MSSVLTGIILLVVELFQPFSIRGGEMERFPCGDLLAAYAQKPLYLEFIGCEEGEGQTIIRAEYRVAGMHSQSVEDFLVGNYGMGKLKWVCCGWENQGKYGSLTHRAITEANSNHIVSISMFASGEIEGEEEEAYLEFDRNKIPYFTVWVEILEV